MLYCFYELLNNDFLAILHNEVDCREVVKINLWLSLFDSSKVQDLGVVKSAPQPVDAMAGICLGG